MSPRPQRVKDQSVLLDPNASVKEGARLLYDCALPAQVCEGTPDSTGRQQGLCVLLLHGVGAAVSDELQRGLLYSCPREHPGGVRSAALRLLAGTSGSGGAAGRSGGPWQRSGRGSTPPP